MDISNMTLEQKIGQVLCCGWPQAGASEGIAELIREHHLGNICLFARNFESAEQLHETLASLQETAMEANGAPLLVGIDQEGGYVTRLTGEVTFFPGAMATSAAGGADDAYIIGKAMGQEMRALGTNFNFAPVLDINTNPENPVINVRSYSDDKERVAECAAAFTRGMQENVIATAKHFPGHGDTHQDSHLTLPTVDYGKERLVAEELYPFKRLIAEGIKAIMTTHIVFPAYDPSGLPATLSEPILTGLLRKELGFDGIIITDCMEMKAIANFYGTVEAVKTALYAGADIILVCHTRERQLASMDELKKAVLADPAMMEKLNTAVERILRFKKTLPQAVPREEMLKTVSEPSHKAEAKRISRASITLFRGEVKPLAPDEPVAAVFFSSRALTGIEERNPYGNLERDFIARYKNANTAVLSLEPGADDVEWALSAVSKHERLVVFTYNAMLFPSQAEAVNKLLEIRPDALIIAMRSPYDLRKFTHARNYVMAYEYTPPAIDSILAMLAGEFKPTGKAPVDILKGL